MRTPALISHRQKTGDTYLRRLVTRVTRLGRTVRLRRQFTDIERRSMELPRSYREQLAELIARECASVEACPDPAAYGTQPGENGIATGGLDVGFDRARSDNVQVRMRGLALWLALVYHETRDAATPEARDLHRAILRVMRELKVFSSRVETDATHA